MISESTTPIVFGELNLVTVSINDQDNKIYLNLNCIKASLDKESLLTKIPLDKKTKNNIISPFSINDTYHNLTKENFKELLKVASCESFLRLITNLIDNYMVSTWDLY